MPITDPRWAAIYEQLDQEHQQVKSRLEQRRRQQTGEQNTSRLGDLGSSFIQGAQKGPGAIAAIADAVSPTTQLTGKALVSDTAEWVGEKTGIQPGKWAEERRQNMSPAALEDRAEIDKAWGEGGFWNIAGAYARNPWYIANLVAESIPYMLFGGALGRVAGAAGTALKAGAAEGSMAARVGGAMSKYRAGIGEGAIAGGLATDALLERDVDPRVATLAGLGTAATTGFFGYQGQRLAQSRGLRDLDLTLTNIGDPAAKAAAIAAREGAEQVPQSLGRRVVEGAAIEGLAEELPQSVTEQFWQNWAEDKPLLEGAARAGVEGALAGSVMGGVMNVPGAKAPRDLTQDGRQVEQEAADIEVEQTPPPRREQQVATAGGALADAVGAAMDQQGVDFNDPPAQIEEELQRAWKERQDRLRQEQWAHVERQKQEQVGALEQARQKAEIQQRYTALEEWARASGVDNGTLGEIFDTAYRDAAQAVEPGLDPDDITILDSYEVAIRRHLQEAVSPSDAPEAPLVTETQPDAQPAEVRPIQTPAQQPGPAPSPEPDLAQDEAAPEVLPDAETITPNAQPTKIQGAVAPDLAAPPVESTVLDEPSDETAPPTEPMPDVTGTEPPLDEPPVESPVPAGTDEVAPVVEEQVAPEVTSESTPQGGVTAAGQGAPNIAAESPSITTEQSASQRVASLPPEVFSNGEKVYFIAPGRESKMWALYEYDPKAPSGRRKQHVTNLSVSREEAEQKARNATQGPVYSFDRVTTPIARNTYGENVVVPVPSESLHPQRRAVLHLTAAHAYGEQIDLDRKSPIPEMRAAVAEAALAGRLAELPASGPAVLLHRAQGKLTLAVNARVNGPVAKKLDALGVDYTPVKGKGLVLAPQDVATAYPAVIEHFTKTPWEQIVGQAKNETQANGPTVESTPNITVEAPNITAEASTALTPVEGTVEPNIDPDTTVEASAEAQAAPIPQSFPALQARYKQPGTLQSARELTEAFMGGVSLRDAANSVSRRFPVSSLGSAVKHVRTLLTEAQALSTDPAEQSALDEALTRLDNEEPYLSTTDIQATNTVETVQARVDTLLGNSRAKSRIVVVQDASEIPPGPSGKASTGRRVQGVTRRGRGQATVYLIAGNIPQGAEVAVILHELGAHVGLARRLGKGGLQSLGQQIVAWAAKNDGSLESRLAQRALKRAPNGKNKVEETVAYFVEEAVLAGLDPVTGKGITGTLKVWFRRFMALVRQVAASVGLPVDRLTPQILVDMAYAMGRQEGEVLAGKVEQLESQAPAEETSTSQNIDTLESALPDPTDIMRGAREFFNDTYFDSTTNAKAWLKQHSPGWLDLRQLADKFKIPEVQAVVDVLLGRKAWVTALEKKDQALVHRWAKLTQEQADTMSWLMRETTRVQYDPDPQAEAHEPTKDKAFKMTKEKKALIDAKWRSLRPETQQLYRDVRDALSTDWDVLEQLLNDAAVDETTRGRVDALKTKLQKLYPYFPLMRLGEHYVVAMSAEFKAMRDKEAQDGGLSTADEIAMKSMAVNEGHFVVKAFPMAAKAAGEEQRLKASGNYSIVYADRSLHRPSRGTASLLPDMGDIQDTLKALLPEEQANQAADLVQQALIAQLPEQHYLTRHLKRKGVRGEETDMRRVFSAHAKARAHYLGHLTFAKRYSDAMSALLKVREDENSPYDRDLVTTAYNEFQKRGEISSVAPHSPWATFAVQWSALSQLALSPAYFLTNLSQVPFIAAPWISARLDPGVAGFERTTRALWRGGKDIAKVLDITRSGINIESELNLEAKDANGRSILTDGEQTLLKRAIEENLLNTGIEIDLGLVASGQDNGIQRLVQSISAPVRITEQLNRGATALAAYRLALAKGLKESEAVNMTLQAIHKTHYDYTLEHAPRHMRQVMGSQNLARIVFQFRRYQVGTLHLLFSSLKQGWYDKAATEQERAEARRTILGIAAMTTAFGGVLMGTPFVGMMLAILSSLGGMGGDDDDPWDLATDIRNWLHDIDPTLADVIAKGLPSLLDMDLSQRVGMGNIANPMPFKRNGDTGREEAEAWLVALAGAPFSTVATTVDGFDKIMEGQAEKGIEQILPLKAAKDLMRAYILATDGQRTATGEQRLGPEDFSGWEVMLRGLGVQPMSQSDYFDANKAIQKRKQAATDTHTKLVGEYARAVIEKKPTAEIRREITAYNQRHPEKGLRITQAMLTRAVKERRKSRRDTNDAGILIQKADRPFEQYGRFATDVVQ